MFLTPGQFEDRMKQINEEDPMPDEKHEKMDKLMCETLEGLGYSAGIEVFEKAEKWYC